MVYKQLLMTIGAPLQVWVIDHDFIKVSHYKPPINDLKTKCMNLIKVLGALDRSNDITIHSYNSCCV
jgi:hypothetical protein